MIHEMILTFSGRKKQRLVLEFVYFTQIRSALAPVKNDKLPLALIHVSMID